MKNTIKSLALIAGVAMLTACGSNNTEEVKTVQAPAEKMAIIDAEGSSVIWTGSKVIGGEHAGTIDIKSADLNYANGSLKGGSIVMDMSTLKNTDLEGEWNEKLIAHLKSNDFFATDSITESSFNISSVRPSGNGNAVEITGDMTIKGITNSETFEAEIIEGENMYLALANVTLDRTDYDVKYGSSNFFEGLGDKAISDDFVLEIRIETPKQ